MCKHFCNLEDLQAITNAAAREYPELIEDDKTFPINKIVSVYYRLLGKKEFNDCFDWEKFKKDREEINLKYNKQSTPNKLNIADIWIQLIDRYGYAGFGVCRQRLVFCKK